MIDEELVTYADDKTREGASGENLARVLSRTFNAIWYAVVGLFGNWWSFFVSGATRARNQFKVEDPS